MIFKFTIRLIRLMLTKIAYADNYIKQFFLVLNLPQIKFENDKYGFDKAQDFQQSLKKINNG